MTDDESEKKLREQAILDLLIEGMRRDIPDTEMTAWVEAELVKRGFLP